MIIGVGLKVDAISVSQGKEFQNKINDLGLNDVLEIYIHEDRDHSNIANDNQELDKRIQQFLSKL